jgi:preprotein translocase subunit SecG
MLLAFLKPFLVFLLPFLSIFLILLILVQRGRGGGLVGAFGGGGGQSAFGAKAGDLFTRITIITVSFWILFCILLLLAMKQGGGNQERGFGAGKTSRPASSASADSNVTTPTPSTTPLKEE